MKERECKAQSAKHKREVRNTIDPRLGEITRCSESGSIDVKLFFKMHILGRSPPFHHYMYDKKHAMNPSLSLFLVLVLFLILHNDQHNIEMGNEASKQNKLVTEKATAKEAHQTWKLMLMSSIATES